MTNRLIATVLAAAAALTLTNAANAADLYRGPSYKAPAYVDTRTWSGPYIGIVGAYGFGDYDITGATVDATGGQVGLTLGYNFQSGNWVFGVEGDANYSFINGDGVCGPGATGCELSNKYLITARGRLGYSFGSFMPYITGGGAFGDLKIERGGVEEKDSRFGYTIGAGLEYAFSRSWSVKGEYLYVDLGTFDCTQACIPARTVDYTTSLIRVGVNYRF